MGAIQYKNIENYLGLGKAVMVQSKAYEIICPVEMGPRIMHFSLPQGKNILEDDVDLNERLPDGQTWRLVGGHRLWHSPEAFPRSYLPDNMLLSNVDLGNDRIVLTQEAEPWTNMKKELEIHFFANKIRVTNRIYNLGAWPVEICVWSLTVGSRGGMAVLPLVQKNTGLLPNAHFVSWPYSRMNDGRLTMGSKYMFIKNEPTDKSAFKIGYLNENSWISYFNHGACFIKKFETVLSAKYPDRGCSCEIYTSYWGTELESLSPLEIVKPQSFIEHSDEWFIYESSKMPHSEDEAEQILYEMSLSAKIQLPVTCNAGWDPTFGM